MREWSVDLTAAEEEEDVRDCVGALHWLEELRRMSSWWAPCPGCEGIRGRGRHHGFLASFLYRYRSKRSPFSPAQFRPCVL